MPQQLQGQPQPITAATGSAKKNSTTRLRDMTKQAKSRSDNSEATSHKESPLSTTRLNILRRRDGGTNRKRKKEKNKTRKIINRNWQNQSWTIRYQNRVRTRRVHFVGRRKRHCGGTVLLVRRRCVTRAA